VNRAVTSLDEAEATFTRKPETVDPKLLAQLAGTYETATGSKFKIVLKEDGSLFFVAPGQPEQLLRPYKGLMFRVKEFSDLVFEFVVENGTVKALKQRDPSGEYTFTRK
jgi:hypothetical protein